MTKALGQRRVKKPGPCDSLRCYARLDTAIAQFERLSQVGREHLRRQGPVPARRAHPEADSGKYLGGDGARCVAHGERACGRRIASQYVAKPAQSEGSAEAGTPNKAANRRLSA